MACNTQCGGVGAFPSLLLLLLLAATTVIGATLPPRLSSSQTTVRLREGQEGYVLECKKDVGDDPIMYRWLKDNEIVTGSLGYAYRGYNKVLLALHKVELSHAGAYVCEASNSAGVDSKSIRVIVENVEKQQSQIPTAVPHTDEILSELAASFSDVLAEGSCSCDTMFLLHVSTDAPDQTLSAQANLVHTIADQIISEENRVSVMTYCDVTESKLSFGKGTNKCDLKNAFKDLTQQKWPTRLPTVMRNIFKKFRKSKSNCKVLFLPIFGSAGNEGADIAGAESLKNLGVKIFILEVTPKPIEGVKRMASERGDGYPYHWWVPQHIWPTIVLNMKYIAKDMVGCMSEEKDIPGKCVGDGSPCTSNSMCRGVGYGCENGQCVFQECNVNTRKPGCCKNDDRPNRFWCGDVTGQCTAANSVCDGIPQCMNGNDEQSCWSVSCPENRIARCQTSTLCLDLMDLCNGEPACPGAEDEDARFCNYFPCPGERPFRCGNGKCISEESVCDGLFKDCEDGEDELFKFCKSVHSCPLTRPFKCDYGVCISERMVCDGTFNCLDASDELVCEEKNCPAQRPFKCLSGLCISMNQVCNGVIDGCDDGSDELNCTNIVCPANRSFKCASGLCIDGSLRCNTRYDCDDGSDELNCPTIPPPIVTTSGQCPASMFRCNDDACIPKALLCNGLNNCQHGEDEENCSEKECPEGLPHRCGDGTCVKETAICNDFEDCPDGSDEVNCTRTDQSDEYDYIYDDIDETEPEEEPPRRTTTTTTTTEPSIEKEGETAVDNEEEETFVEEIPVEEPTHLEESHNDKDDKEDMEAVETMVETMGSGEPAASSEQGVDSSPCVTPACVLLFLPSLFVLTFGHIWVR